jgi:hypothetical protein
VVAPPSFAHLLSLSDSVGVFEHARRASPLHDHGYCTDDVARALVVTLREPERPPALERLAETCLAFLEAAQLPDGRFHNRRAASPGHPWTDEVGSDDAIGRALWGLGTAAARAPSADARTRALGAFERGSAFSTPSPRANAAAALGAVEVLSADRGNRRARALLDTSAGRLGELSPDPGWPWPEVRLAYENARLPEARIAAGVSLTSDTLVAEGLGLLRWLVEIETRDEHFSFAPVGGWARGEPRPGFDQQPTEAGAMADACARAFDATGDERWATLTLRAARWFLGDNDVGVSLFDPRTQGCRDGLEADGCNANQGAESTLALISALQQARRLERA